MNETSMTTKSTSFAQLLAGKVAGISFFQQPNARVLAKAKINLAVAGIHANDACRPMLQKAIGEPAGGGAYVQTYPSGNLNFPVIQCLLQLEAAAAHIFEIFAKNADLRVILDGSAGFFNFLAIHQNFSSQNERLGALAGRSNATLKEQLVNTRFHEAGEKENEIVRDSSTLPRSCQHPRVCKV